jgi:hypothetical protein
MNDINDTVLPRRASYLDPWWLGPCSWGGQGPVQVSSLPSCVSTNTAASTPPFSKPQLEGRKHFHFVIIRSL